MSYDFLIYARRDHLPSADRLRSALLEANPSISVPASFDLGSSGGYVHVDFGGQSTGFDLLVSQLGKATAEDYAQDLQESGEADDGFLEVLTSNDTFISLSGKDDQEVAAARTVAIVIARLSGAYLSDPQTATRLS